jgi:hypothetical protein
MEDALEFLANELGLEKSDFEFIGIKDYSIVGMGILLFFNVVKETHKKYCSTVSYTLGGIND